MASFSPISVSDFENSDNPVVSVQELIKKPLPAVPNQYVRFERGPSTDVFDNLCGFATIPTIDMNNLVTAGETADLELEKLHSTCKDWGIFQLVNGVSPLLLEKLKNEVEGFFKLPLDEKKKYKIRPGDVEGYGTVNRTDDQKVDWSDRVYMTLNPISRRKPYLFPELPSSLRTTIESYFKELQKLAMTLFVLLGKALKIDGGVMKDLFEDGMQSVRMTYYPPCPQPELVVGISPHSDATGITILHQLNGSVNGLQIKKDGVWNPVNFLQDALMVNVGDILEIMSNGAYKSIEHRVMANSIKERISVAVFFNPKYEAEIGPLEILVKNSQNPPLFKRIGMEKYVHDLFSRRKLDGKSFLKLMRIKNDENTNDYNIS